MFLRYPATRKGLTFLFGQEQSRDDRNMIKLLKDEISSSRGAAQIKTWFILHLIYCYFPGKKRNDLIRFEKALKHIILYDTPTKKGKLDSYQSSHSVWFKNENYGQLYLDKGLFKCIMLTMLFPG